MNHEALEQALFLAFNALTALSYVVISSTLAYLLYRARNDLPFQRVFVAFGAFILSCGLSHAAMLYDGAHNPSHLSLTITGIMTIASVVTAVWLPFMLPIVLHFIVTAKESEQRKDMIRQRDEFLAILSHELKTPLTSMTGFITILKRRMAKAGIDNPGVLDAASVIETQNQRLYRLIMEMSQLSRIERGQLELRRTPVNLVDVVREIAKEFSLTVDTPHTIDLRAHVLDLPIYGDRDMLSRALANLVANAIKYSPHGGVVEINVNRDRHMACITVGDEGIGVPEHDREHLFERFYRASNVNSMQIHGLGVGLHIAQEIAHRHGGNITYAERAHRGSYFTLCLPCATLMPTADRTGEHYTSSVQV